MSITVHPGPPVILDRVDVRVVGPGADSRLFKRITSHLPFHTGERLKQAQYDSVRGDLLRTAATYGYLDATLTRHELLVNPGAHTASVALELQTGRALPLRRHHDRAARREREAGAQIPALPRRATRST